MAKIEIDDKIGIIERVSGFSFFQKKERFELFRYESVRLSERATAAEEGYVRMWYSVCLVAADDVLELLSTDDENEARSLYRRLTVLLSQRTPGRNGSA